MVCFTIKIMKKQTIHFKKKTDIHPNEKFERPVNPLYS